MLIKILSYRRTLMESTEDEKKPEKKSVLSQYNLRIDKQTTSHEIVAFFMLSTLLFRSLFNFFPFETVVLLEFLLDSIQKYLFIFSSYLPHRITPSIICQVCFVPEFIAIQNIRSIL